MTTKCFDSKPFSNAIPDEIWSCHVSQLNDGETCDSCVGQIDNLDIQDTNNLSKLRSLCFSNPSPFDKDDNQSNAQKARARKCSEWAGSFGPESESDDNETMGKLVRSYCHRKGRFARYTESDLTRELGSNTGLPAFLRDEPLCKCVNDEWVSDWVEQVAADYSGFYTSDADPTKLLAAHVSCVTENCSTPNAQIYQPGCNATNEQSCRSADFIKFVDWDKLSSYNADLSVPVVSPDTRNQFNCDPNKTANELYNEYQANVIDPAEDVAQERTNERLGTSTEGIESTSTGPPPLTTSPPTTNANSQNGNEEEEKVEKPFDATWIVVIVLLSFFVIGVLLWKYQSRKKTKKKGNK